MPTTCPTSHGAEGTDAPDRLTTTMLALDDIADRVLRIGLLGGGLVSQLPEPARPAALRHLDDLDAVAASLRDLIVELHPTG